MKKSEEQKCENFFLKASKREERERERADLRIVEVGMLFVFSFFMPPMKDTQRFFVRIRAQAKTLFDVFSSRYYRG